MAKKKRKTKNLQQKLNSQLAILNSKKSTKSEKRRARKYIEMKSNKLQKIEPVPSSITMQELNSWKLQLTPMVEEANKRIEMIQSAGYTSYALDRVIREGGQEYFDLENVTTRDDLLKEITRMRVFINDKGSTVEGAKIETAQMYASQYKGKFGNEYNNEENQFARFDIKAIDKDVASRAFESYRKIEEHRATEIVNDGAYGSENLIIALYDAEIRGLDSLVYGEELLDSFVQTNTIQWQNAKKDSDSIIGISGIIEDNLIGRRNF